MKFKEIKPGMVIHCPTEEDARALTEHLKEVGYDVPSLLIHKYYYIGDDLVVTWTDTYPVRPNAQITEFSDLIESDDFSTINKNDCGDIGGWTIKPESPMTAVEVLEWLAKYRGKEDSRKCFGRMYDTDILLNQFTPEEIIQKITAYEAAKKPKPVEVESGYYCRVYTEKETVAQFTDWGIDEQTAKDTAIDMAMKHAEEWDEPTFVDVSFVCRVKEDKV